MPIIEIVGKDGKFNEKAGKYEGMKSLEARKAIIKDLEEAGHIEKIEPIRHVVNIHERCKTDIEILTSRQWFLKYMDLKKEFLKKGEELNWYPKYMKVRYDNWIKGLKWDWSLSRQRFFGVPFPVWYCKECDHEIMARIDDLPVDPMQDKPPIEKCPKCGCTEFVPEKDVLDTWMTSSLTPQINSKWATDEEFHKKLFPMSMRPQAHDIITLWAFNTVVKAYLHEKKLPWKDIMVSGHALDSKGRKMSKSLGNAVDPNEMIKKYSADILRYWAASGTLGDDLPLQEKEFVSGRKFIVKILNAAKFVNIATKEFKETSSYNFRVPDLWIMSRFNQTKKIAEENLEKYEFAKALSVLRNFFWLEFADFYIEEVKYRIYGKNKESREAAQQTLLSIMLDMVKMLAPYVPHTAEEIYLEVFKSRAAKKSVHVCSWPETDEEKISEENEEKGELLKEIVSALRKHKSELNLPLNSTLETVRIITKAEKTKEILKETEEEIKNIMAVKNISFAEKESGKGTKAKVNDNLILETE